MNNTVACDYLASNKTFNILIVFDISIKFNKNRLAPLCETMQMSCWSFLASGEVP